jgi:uncharacterized membrane protein
MELVMKMPDQDSPTSVLAFAIGMITGMAIGFVLWIAMDNFALLPAFVGVGLILGMVLQSAVDRRNHD